MTLAALGDSCKVASGETLSVPRALGSPGREIMPRSRRESKFEVYGEEMLEKVVAKSGSSGRVYLPPDWVGKRVKIIRVD